jgi:ketosteroid isomerase-like protein
MKKTMSILIVCFLISITGGAQSKEEKEVSARVETLRKAMQDADKAALENIAAEEISYGHSNGKIEDKAAFVEAIVSGKNDFIKIEVTELSVKIVGNTAIVRHKLSGDVANDGKPGTINLGLLLVWQKQKNEWKLIARQGFKL